MANYSNLLATIAANIYTNGNGEITAAMVKTALDAVVAALAAGYIYKGKTGTYANESWADDGTRYAGEVISPDTGDACGVVLALGLSGITAFWAKRRKNRA